MTENRLKACFPYFGGKSRVAPEVWHRFGVCSNYIEPFFGSGAVLLARPDFNPAEPFIETVNDINAWLANFWRAVSADAEAVAEHADYPVSELDLHARGDAIFYRDDWYRERGHASVDAWIEWIRADPRHYDSKIAGWWVWGMSAWIGDNWGRAAHNAKRDPTGAPVAVTRARPAIQADRQGRGIHVERKLPIVAGDRIHGGQVWRSRPDTPGHIVGRGIHRQHPVIDGAVVGNCIHRQMPHIDGQAYGDGVHQATRAGILATLTDLQTRLRRVRICCGDWSRICGPTPTRSHGVCAVFLDPPYGQVGRDSCYGEHEDFAVAARAREWAIAHGDDPHMRIALCGYAGEHSMPPGWQCLSWKTAGGYGNQRRDKTNLNSARERIWFSPHCLHHSDMPLFAGVNA